jgi:hypothetical protein
MELEEPTKGNFPLVETEATRQYISFLKLAPN